MKLEKVKLSVANLHDKTKYVIHIRNLKHITSWSSFEKKVQRVIRFNQNAWLKSFVDVNADLRKKNDLEKDFLG